MKGNAIGAVASWAQGSGADARAASLRTWAWRQVQLRVELADAKLFSLRMGCAPA